MSLKIGKLLIGIFVILLVMISTSFAQNSVPELDYSTPNPTTYIYENGGYKITSVGEINILLVFAEFPDDQWKTTDARWIKGQPPQNMNDWVDETWSYTPTQGSLTHYFNEMSGNKLRITGKGIHIVAPHTRAYYKNYYTNVSFVTPNRRRGYIQKELIQQIDSYTDFEQFDNWGLVADYTHDNNPDNQVDMIIFVWRNTAEDSSDYKDDLGFGSSYGDLGGIGTFSVDGSSGRYVNTNTFGSGATVIGYLMNDPYTDPFKVVVHEFAHYLLGWNDMHNGYGFWGMLSDWGVKSIVANSFERRQLNWIDDPNGDYTIDASSSSVQTLTKSLGDYVTNNQSIKIIVNNSSYEYFYIENHQNLSYWETHMPFSANPDSIYGLIEPGIYIIRQKDMKTVNNYSQVSRMLIPADGRYAWEVNSAIPNPFGGPRVLPLWENMGYDRLNGYHTLERAYHNYSSGENPSTISLAPSSTSPYWVYISEHAGDGKDAFRMGYKEVFSPWSNPNNQRENRSTVNFSMKLNSESYGIYSLTFYMNNPEDAPPSVPENLAVTWSGSNPVLTWDQNIEPDLQSYKIYKMVEGETGWKNIATVSSTTTQWTDRDVSRPGKFDPIYTIDYKIRAVDQTNKYSIYTDIEKISATTNVIWKQNISGTEAEGIETYELFSNYPNPFNPATQITYQIPKSGFVNLVIYNSLGQLVSALVNERKEKGRYTVEFNAANLPSGMYIYRITAGKYRASGKMLLMK